MSNKPNPLTRADLTAAAWHRFETARAAVHARARMIAARKPFEKARDDYTRAREAAEESARAHELMEQRMLLQETADEMAPVRAVAS